jgi:cation diffusion facilitator family transporter
MTDHHRHHDHTGRAPHRHDHGDAIADHLEASREGLRALWISLGGLGLTALAQAAVCAASGSVALLSDTIHNVSDALTAVPLGVAFVLGRRRPTRRYTYGYGRAEDLAGVCVVAVIALSATIAASQAVARLVDPRPMHQAGWVAAAGLVGFVGNEAVARYRLHVGRRIGSTALVADGLHARTDGLTSVAVLGAALGSLAGWDMADPVVGLVISVAIIRVLRIAARDVSRRLMDGVDPELVDTVADRLGAVPGVRSVDRVRMRWTGHQLHVDADVELDADLPLARAHEILEDARHTLLHHVARLADAHLHASPAGDGGVDPHAGTRHHFVTTP